MRHDASVHLFLAGRDYHLGDLLWLTAVLAEYRRQVQPRCLLLGVPDRPISRILEHNPLFDELLLGEPGSLLLAARQRIGRDLLVHDLRPPALARAMLQDWRHHLPWLYYRDLWFEGRGQWLATFLHLGQLSDFRPRLTLTEEDCAFAWTLPARYIALAPHVGQYTLPFASTFWRRIKGWREEYWTELARRLRAEGYEPVTLAARGQDPIPGTIPVIGQPIRQVAGVIDRAAGLVTVESGLWYIAAARETPFIILPWWLPHSINWPAPMNVPHRLIYREHSSVCDVMAGVSALMDGTTN